MVLLSRVLSKCVWEGNSCIRVSSCMPSVQSLRSVWQSLGKCWQMPPRTLSGLKFLLWSPCWGTEGGITTRAKRKVIGSFSPGKLWRASQAHQPHRRAVVRGPDMVKIRFLSCKMRLWSWRFPRVTLWAKGKAGHTICLQTLDNLVSAIAVLYLALNSCSPAKWKIRVRATKRIHLIPPIKSSLWSVKLVRWQGVWLCIGEVRIFLGPQSKFSKSEKTQRLR